MIDTHFYERLANWRRVYGDKPVRWRSPTDTFCRYAKCYFERAPETEEEKFWREVTELKGRDPLLPTPDYSDAELLQRAWMSLPDRIDGMPVKHNVKVFVFGSPRDYERLMRKARITVSGEKEWRRVFLEAFDKKIRNISVITSSSPEDKRIE